MKIEINIQNRHVLIILLFIIAASAIGLVMAYGGTQPSTMGHTLSEITLDTPATFGGTVTVNEGWSPNQAVSISSNQIWKSVSAADPTLYLQWSTEGGNVQIGKPGSTNGLTVYGSEYVRDYLMAAGLCIGSFSNCRTTFPIALGDAIPASTTCLCHNPMYPFNPPFTTTLLPSKMTANNSRMAMEYSQTNACTNCGTSFTCTRYYFGNSEWSSCAETSVMCECIIEGGG